MAKAFLAAQTAAKAGNAAALTQARNRVQGLFAALFTQAIVTYVHEVALDKAAGLAPTEPPAIEHQVRPRPAWARRGRACNKPLALQGRAARMLRGVARGELFFTLLQGKA
jgi:hypothetical protein